VFSILNYTSILEVVLQQCISWSGYHSYPQGRVISHLMLSYQQKS